MPVPADPKRPFKAYIATAVSALSIFVTAWVSDTDPFTSKEIAAAVVAALIGAGLTGAGTFAIANPPKPVGGAVAPGEGGYTSNNLIGLLVTVILVILLVYVILALVR